jgi:hypothetical protein
VSDYFDPNSPAYARTGGEAASLPAGRHLVTVTDASRRDTLTSSLVEVTFEVSDPTAPTFGDRHEREAFFLSETAKWKLAELCRQVTPAAGPFDLADESSLRAALVGRSVAVTVAPSKRETARRAFEVSAFHRLTSSELARLELPAQPMPQPAAKPPAPAPAPSTLAPIGDEEIPF